MASTPSTKDGTNNKAYRPAFKDMIVSISRHKVSFEDTTFTYQFPLSCLGRSNSDPPPTVFHYLSLDAYTRLDSIIDENLRVSRTDMSLVWCLTESDQVAIIKDFRTLGTAVLDHQNAGKGMVQLYLVKSYGKMVHGIIATRLSQLTSTRHDELAQAHSQVK